MLFFLFTFSNRFEAWAHEVEVDSRSVCEFPASTSRREVLLNFRSRSNLELEKTYAENEPLRHAFRHLTTESVVSITSPSRKEAASSATSERLFSACPVSSEKRLVEPRTLYGRLGLPCFPNSGSTSTRAPAPRWDWSRHYSAVIPTRPVAHRSSRWWNIGWLFFFLVLPWQEGEGAERVKPGAELKGILAHSLSQTRSVNEAKSKMFPVLVTY